jgi:peroxiredoxin family protein
MSHSMTSDLAFTPELERLIDERVDARVGQIQQTIDELAAELAELRSQQPADRATIVLTSNDLDRVMPAFIIATGAASFGMEATIFCTLWGINVLKDKTIYSGKSFIEKAMTWMMPSHPGELGLTKMHFWGAGAALMRHMMKTHNVESIPSLIDLAVELEVRIVACQMTMGIMGISTEEIRPGVEFGGVATYIEDASNSKITLFI